MAFSFNFAKDQNPFKALKDTKYKRENQQIVHLFFGLIARILYSISRVNSCLMHVEN
jgi:hypothetical protein